MGFIDEPQGDRSAPCAVAPLVILVVDDDQAVHDATALALAGERVCGRPLALIHAQSAAEGRMVLAGGAAVDLVLLDVVMETEDAGLRLARAIRDELGLLKVRILIRTGQPGLAPEAAVRRMPGIDGYVTKVQLTRGGLLSTLESLLSEASGG